MGNENSQVDLDTVEQLKSADLNHVVGHTNIFNKLINGNQIESLRYVLFNFKSIDKLKKTAGLLNICIKLNKVEILSMLITEYNIVNFCSRVVKGALIQNNKHIINVLITKLNEIDKSHNIKLIKTLINGNIKKELIEEFIDIILGHGLSMADRDILTLYIIVNCARNKGLWYDNMYNDIHIKLLKYCYNKSRESVYLKNAITEDNDISLELLLNSGYIVLNKYYLGHVSVSNRSTKCIIFLKEKYSHIFNLKNTLNKYPVDLIPIKYLTYEYLKFKLLIDSDFSLNKSYYENNYYGTYIHHQILCKKRSMLDFEKYHELKVDFNNTDEFGATYGMSMIMKRKKLIYEKIVYLCNKGMNLEQKLIKNYDSLFVKGDNIFILAVKANNIKIVAYFIKHIKFKEYGPEALKISMNKNFTTITTLLFENNYISNPEQNNSTSIHVSETISAYCALCNDNLKSVVYIPCMHCIICKECNNKVKPTACSVCKQHISSKIDNIIL